MKLKEHSEGDVVTINLDRIKQKLNLALEEEGLVSPGPIHIDVVSTDPLGELQFEISILAHIKRS